MNNHSGWNLSGLRLLPALAVICVVAGCRTTPMPPVNLDEPGWTIQRGQALWRARADSREIAGELLVAINPDGRQWVQFTKTPLPMIVARRNSQRWEIQFVPENRLYSDDGAPPDHFMWLHLPDYLAGQHMATGWKFERLPGQRWRLDNPATGERIEGHVQPGLPNYHIVRGGDTLSSVAGRYGIAIKDLIAANPDLKLEPATLNFKPGQKLTIPIP